MNLVRPLFFFKSMYIFGGFSFVVVFCFLFRQELATAHNLICLK